MADYFTKETVSDAIKKIIEENMAADSVVNTESSSPDRGGSVKHIKCSNVKCEAFPFDIGVARKAVFSKDILSLSESPRLGAGLMEVCGVSFPWVLHYDEVEYVIEGVLNITANGERITGTAGDVIFIPKDTSIEFSSPSRARFLYVTYPADWQSQ